MSNTTSDKAIVELYLARDSYASELCYRKYGAQLKGFASRFLSDHRDVEECVNDTLLKTWNAIPPNEPQELFPFLAKICRCTAINIINKEHAAKRTATIVELTHEMEECIPSNLSEYALHDEDLTALIDEFLKKLSRDNRIVFIRHYWFGETISEISHFFGFSESKVKTSLHRTRQSLKKYLLKKGVRP